MHCLTARWVLPVTAPPIADGAVAVDGGRIVAVGRRADVCASHAGRRWDLGDAALLPGLVNCHSHLEIGPIPGGAPAEPFVPWVLRVIEQRKAVSLVEQARTAETGAQALLRTGTTTVGEVSATGQSLTPLLRVGLRGVVYREILGVSPQDAPERLNAARADLLAMQARARGTLLAIGLSPHSAYALCEELLSACGGLVRATDISPAIHVAESPAECEFLTTGGGPIAHRLYPAVGCGMPPFRRTGRSPVAYLEAAGVLAWQPLLVHAVHVDEADCRVMVQYGVRVAHCPRSNSRLSEGTAPVRRFLSHGIPVGLGTDSLASAPDLDMWEEMRAALAAHAGGVDPTAVLEMATLGGARALRLADRIGSLTVGKRADIIAVPARHITTDPVGSLLEQTRGEDVLLVLIDGAMRHSRTEVATCA